MGRGKARSSRDLPKPINPTAAKIDGFRKRLNPSYDPCPNAVSCVEARYGYLRTSAGRRLPGLRPGDALVACNDAAHALEYEFLQAFPFPGLRRVEVALGVGCNVVQSVELAGLAAAVAERSDFLQRLAQDDTHAVVHAVSQEHEALFRIARECDVPG